MVTLAVLILILPLVSFLISPWIKSSDQNPAGLLSSLILFVSFAGTLALWFLYPNLEIQVQWISLDAGAYLISEKFGISLNPQMGLLLCLVALISFLVHVFSIEYMKHDPSQGRYFAYLGLFTFSMFGIIVSSSLVQLFLFWEMVGLSSFLLIGFWYKKPDAAAAGKKAFVVNRVADSALLLGLIMLWVEFGSTDISIVNEVSITQGPIFWSGLLILIGAMGKSAMFPFHVWLPDAMEGPTPVSALLHAATMVTAGIILISRLFPLFDPVVLDVMILVGAVSAIVGGFAAMMQYDLKRVLAYSTISQLGFMMAALGAGASGVALFHLLTHAFFKAGLFLTAGALIHGLHGSQVKDVQDMRNLGGLRSRMPLVFYSFAVFGAALVGLPLLSGFLSKDAILEVLSNNQSVVADIGLYVLLFAILLTAMYVGRLMNMVFFGKTGEGLTVSKLKLPIVAPITVLALGSLWFWYSLNPISTQSSWALALLESENLASQGLWIPITSVIIVGIGLFLSTRLANAGKHDFLFNLGYHNFYLDNIYNKTFVSAVHTLAKASDFSDRRIIDGAIHSISRTYVVVASIAGFVDSQIVDGLVNAVAKLAAGTGKLLAGIQSGKIQSYILAALLGILILLWILVL
jgi:NADH-quinone oxidoreductase subunit L